MDNNDKEIREEFKKLIESYKITDDSTKEEIKIFLNKISDWLIENIPQKLYRYRSCTDYNIHSLENDEIWGSSLLNLNDSFEGIPSFDLEKVNQDINSSLTKKGINNCIESISKFGYPDRYEKMLPEEKRKIFIENLKENLENKELATEKLYNFFSSNEINFINNLNNELVNLIKDIYINIDLYRSFKKIACFSTDYKSSLMWGHYADGNKGFVIEYNLSELIKKCSMKCKKENLKKCDSLGLNYLLVPVIYRKNSYDGTDFLIQNIMYNFLSIIFNSNNSNKQIKYFDTDTLFYLKLILNKSEAWSYEKEWRLVANLQSKTEQFTPECILKCRPKKIFLGARMKEENRKKIIEICKRKNIEYDEMLVNYLSNDYSIEAKSYLEKNDKPIIKL